MTRDEKIEKLRVAMLLGDALIAQFRLHAKMAHARSEEGFDEHSFERFQMKNN